MPLRVCARTMTVITAAFAAVMISAAIARADYTVSSCGANYNEDVFSAVLPPGGSVNTEGSSCPAGAGGGLQLWSSKSLNAGDDSRGAWQAKAPSGLEIVAASVAAPGITTGNINNSNSPWGGGVYWASGGQKLPTELDAGVSWSGFVSPYFGFQLVCGASPCGENHRAELEIKSDVNLSVHETTGP